MADRFLQEDGSGVVLLEDGVSAILAEQTGLLRAISEDNPIAHWRFGEGSGLPQDRIGTAHVDTIVGTPTYGIVHDVGDGDTAIAVSGAANYLRIANNPQLNVGAGPVTVEVLLRRTSVGAPASMQVFGRGGNGYAIGFNTSDKLYFAKQGVATIATESATTADAYWHHFIATWDGATAHIWKDGLDVTSFVGAQTLADPSATSYITGNGGTLGYDGEIDELAIYASILSSTRVGVHFAEAGQTGAPTVADVYPYIGAGYYPAAA